MKIVVLDAKTLGSDLDLSPLQALGEVVIYPLTASDEVAARVADADVVLTNKVQLNATTLGTCAQLKMIGVFATGYNNIDLDFAKLREIAVANVAGYSTTSVAQHTFALLLQMLEQLSFYDAYVKDQSYVKSDTFAYIAKPFYEIAGKTWGIIGMGAIGQEVARLAEAFGANVIYYSTSGKNTAQNYPQVDLQTLLQTSHILSIHAPLNDQTQGLIGAEAFDLMKKEAILVNVGRGGIVDEAALAEALNSDKIRGAALDVLVQEPIAADSPLYTIKDNGKWLVTPHIAWASIEARTNLLQEVIANIQAFYNGIERNRLV